MPLAGLSGLDDTPDEAVGDRAFHLIAQARRLASQDRFSDANARLDEVDKIVPGLIEAAEARRKIAELATPEGQFALQIDRARIAVGNDDYAGAEKELAEAARLKPEAPEIAELRQAMQAAQQKEARRSSRVAASRVDVLDPALDQARTGLAERHEEWRDRLFERPYVAFYDAKTKLTTVLDIYLPKLYSRLLRGFAAFLLYASLIRDSKACRRHCAPPVRLLASGRAGLRLLDEAIPTSKPA